jgi:hypothetical protein
LVKRITYQKFFLKIHDMGIRDNEAEIPTLPGSSNCRFES